MSLRHTPLMTKLFTIALCTLLTGCAASRPPPTTRTPPTPTVDASAMDAAAPADVASDSARAPRWVRPTSSARDGGVAFDGPPRSFAELLDSQRPVFWRTGSRRGSVCSRWRPRASNEDGAPDTLATEVSIRCVRYTASARVVFESPTEVVLRGIGGSTSSRTGGMGWMRGPGSGGTRVQWIESDERRVRTSEGDWFLSAEACEGSSAELPSARPSGWDDSMGPDEAMRVATSAEELRWVVASYEPEGTPARILAGVSAVFRDRAALWEPTRGGRSCRAWSVRVEDQRVSLTRVIPQPGGGRHTVTDHVSWRPTCGEFEGGGCVHTIARPGEPATMQASSGELMFSVHDVGPGWVEIGQLRVFSDRAGCMRSPARRYGPVFDGCDH